MIQYYFCGSTADPIVEAEASPGIAACSVAITVSEMWVIHLPVTYYTLQSARPRVSSR